MLFLGAIRREVKQSSCSGYPWSVAALRTLDELPFKTAITFFAGENGSGKSTLLEGLAAGMGAHAIGHAGQVENDPYLSHAMTVSQGLRFSKKRLAKTRMFMRAEDVLGYIRHQNADRLDDYRYERERQRASGQDAPEESPEIEKGIIRGNPLDSCSHGEGFLEILQSRLHGGGLYFLDEPDSPLSPTAQLTLATLIRSCAQNGAQFIIATHSPILLSIPEATIYEFGAEGVLEKRFDDLPAVRFLRRFLEKPIAYLDGASPDHTVSG